MGFWKKLKQSLAGGGVGSKGDPGLYFYVKLERSGEIVELRLIPGQELVPDYNTGTYFTRKAIIGPRSFERAEATFHFDNQRRFDRAEISGGELTDEEAYRRQQEANA
jgi:hypothetical protein